MKVPSLLYVPNYLTSSRKTNRTNKNNVERVRMSNEEMNDFCANKIPIVYRTNKHNGSTPSYHHRNGNNTIDNKRVVYHNDVTKPEIVNRGFMTINKSNRVQSCLDAIPCLNVKSEANPSVSMENIEYINYETITNGSINNIPTEYYIKHPTTNSYNLFEAGYNDKVMRPLMVDNTVYQTKQYVQPSSSTVKQTYVPMNNTYSKPVQQTYISDLNNQNKVTNNLGSQKKVTVEKTIKSQNNIKELIKEKDKHILELEKGLNIENRECGKKYTELDKKICSKNCQKKSAGEDTNTLQRELLDQKIKYEETLKHLKKVETEKKNLKSNVAMRNKVLSKLDNEIGFIDNENDYLRKIRAEASLNDVHDVFKYLHNKKDKGKMDLNTNDKKKRRQSKNNNIDNDSNDLQGYSELVKQRNDVSCLYGLNYCEGSNPTNSDETSSDDNSYVNNEEKTSIMKKQNKKKQNKKKQNYKIGKTNLDKNDIYSLKSIIVKLEKELEEVKEENKNVNFKYENTFETLSELRKDTLEYMESIVSRDMRIGYMESMLQKSEKDLNKLKGLYKNEQITNREKIKKLLSEEKILKKQSDHLQSMIQEKDAQNVLLKSDIVRNEILINQLEERTKELQGELKLMCNNLENVIDVSNKKDIYMNELEKQLRENEVSRQNAYLSEIAKNRKAHTNLQFKEMLYEKSAQNDLNQLHTLKKELYLNQIHMEKAKHAFEILKNAPKFDAPMINIKKNKKINSSGEGSYNHANNNTSDENNHNGNSEDNTVHDETSTYVKK